VGQLGRNGRHDAETDRHRSWQRSFGTPARGVLSCQQGSASWTHGPPAEKPRETHPVGREAPTPRHACRTTFERLNFRVRGCHYCPPASSMFRSAGMPFPAAFSRIRYFEDERGKLPFFLQPTGRTWFAFQIDGERHGKRRQERNGRTPGSRSPSPVPGRYVVNVRGWTHVGRIKRFPRGVVSPTARSFWVHFSETGERRPAKSSQPGSRRSRGKAAELQGPIAAHAAS